MSLSNPLPNQDSTSNSSPKYTDVNLGTRHKRYAPDLCLWKAEKSVILWGGITEKYCCIGGKKLVSYERTIVLTYQKFCLQDLPDKINIKSLLNLNKRGITQAFLSLLSCPQSPGSSLHSSPWLRWPSGWSEGSVHMLACSPAILFLSTLFRTCSSQKGMGKGHILCVHFLMPRGLCQNAVESSDLLNTLNFCHVLKVNVNDPLQICLFHSLGSHQRQSNHLLLLSLSFLDSQTIWFTH